MHSFPLELAENLLWQASSSSLRENWQWYLISPCLCSSIPNPLVLQPLTVASKGLQGHAAKNEDVLPL